MFHIECRFLESNPEHIMQIWGEWFRFSVPTEDGTKCAIYLKTITEKSGPTEVSKGQYIPKQFRMVYIPQ